MNPRDPAGPPDDSDAPPTLWQELADGSAATGVKVAVCVGLAPLLIGAALMLTYLLALAGFAEKFAPVEYTIPDDDVTAVLLTAAGLLYVVAVAWVWTRNRPGQRPIWGAALRTVGVGASTTLACVLAEETARGAEEVVIGGLICLAAGGVVIIWVQAARRLARGTPVRDRQDGALDVRCPACGYRMVGLHESRCPECGTGYTLDELLARQHFLTAADRRGALAQAPPQPPPRPPVPTGKATASA